MNELDLIFLNIRYNSENEVYECLKLRLVLVLGIVVHPFEYSSVLVQMGHEPIPARHGTSFLGKPIMVLPNINPIFQYVGYIGKIDGVGGCFRGLAPKFVGPLVSMLFCGKFADMVGLPATDDEDKDHFDLNDEELYVQFKVNLKRDVVLSVSGIIISHPFHGISLRMMAQFIGHETLNKQYLVPLKKFIKLKVFWDLSPVWFPNCFVAQPPWCLQAPLCTC